MKTQGATEDVETSQITIEMSEPPEGWAMTRMGEIAEVIGGGTPKASDPGKFSDEGYPWVTPADLGGFAGTYIQRGRRSLSEKGLRHSSAQLMPPRAVLMSSRAPIGYVAIAANEISTNQGFKSFVLYKDILPEYVFYWLKFLKPYLEEFGSGSTFAEISGSRAKEIPILIAPLAEQKRIVAKITELLARVNATRERLAKVPAILKSFRQAVLAAACCGRLTEDWRKNHRGTPVEKSIQDILQARVTPAGLLNDNLSDLPDTWQYINSASLFHFVTSGSRGWARHYASSGPIFIRVGNLDHESIELDFTNLQHVKPPNNAERERTRVRRGDILISITADVGMVAIVPNNIPEAYVNQHVAIARPVDGINKEYLAWFLAAPTGGQKQFQELQRGATKAGLGLDDIKSVAVPFPPLEEQAEIVRRTHSLFRLADLIGSRLTLATSRITGLTESFLGKAFRGELVATEAELAYRHGYSYESGADLLERIRKERQTSTETQSKGEAETMAKRSKVSKASARRQLVSVLVESNKRLTPDELLRQAGFDEDSIEDFYEELRAGIAAGKITEKRPNNTEVYLEVTAS
jgi:type I restriction enzyme S subunit